MGQYLQGMADDVEGEPGVQRLYAQYTSGGTGAVPANPAAGVRDIGFLSIARTGTGVVDFILNNPAFKLLGWIATVEPASYAYTAAGSGVNTLADAVNATIPKVTVTFRRGDTGAAVDTASGDIVKLILFLKAVSLGG